MVSTIFISFELKLLEIEHQIWNRFRKIKKKFYHPSSGRRNVTNKSTSCSPYPIFHGKNSGAFSSVSSSYLNSVENNRKYNKYSQKTIIFARAETVTTRARQTMCYSEVHVENKWNSWLRMLSECIFHQKVKYIFLSRVEEGLSLVWEVVCCLEF